MPIDEQTSCIAYDAKWEFPKERLRLGKTIVDLLTKLGYRFTKGLTPDLNLHTHLKLEYNKKIHQLYPADLEFFSLVPILLNFCLLLFLT